MKKVKKLKPLSDLEWTTCWMAIRYAENRQTIASATLPYQIIEGYYERFSDDQKNQLYKELKQNEEDQLKYNKTTAFGDPNIDRPTWLKFMSALDTENHYKINLIDGTEPVVFKANNRIYPLEEYIKSPWKEIFIPDESIVK